MSLVLSNGPSGRRTGLTRNVRSSLLQNFNASSEPTMPPRAVTKREAAKSKVAPTALVKAEQEDEEDLLRPPDSDSDEEEARADIQKTAFINESKEGEEQKEEAIATTGGRRKRGTAVANGNAATNPRPKRGKVSPEPSQSNDDPKEKSQAQQSLGAGMLDGFGRAKVKKSKAARASYSKKPFQAPPTIKSGL
jgi:hypothetical protein